VASSWLPIQLTQMAGRVDSLFYVLLGVVTFFFILVEVLLITFLIRYRRTKSNRVGYNIHGSNKFELIWTLIPAAILVFLGAYSVRDVYQEQTPAANPYVIKVTGHEWYWEFQYPNGADTQNDLRIPAGQEVLFDITSADVDHGFYIPVARMQQDAVPGRLTQFSLTAKVNDIATPAEYGKQFLVPCDQFCGVGHPRMDAHLTVLSQADFQQWVENVKHGQSSNS
jgi:cytochrome c oxidase subunit II